MVVSNIKLLKLMRIHEKPMTINGRLAAGTNASAQPLMLLRLNDTFTQR